ncbi:hypothetical protein AN396_01585 [Candidatus Epulonipiscium fishelsonii]|uniref:Uncharacterized protein n=1 Tax=Candidatus Epulonipiscium fishelsonii TaxID=77094 RepID=A0ACC8X848_9FIRM|nr:hypothetical protein AN396_01585 [Epulopiscium sp. SCG-B11WGA-EpuloA1]
MGRAHERECLTSEGLKKCLHCLFLTRFFVETSGSFILKRILVQKKQTDSETPVRSVLKVLKVLEGSQVNGLVR